MSQLEIFQHGDYFPGNLTEYHPGFFDAQESASLMAALFSTIQWRQETLFIYGRPVKTPRLTAWYGDEGVAYKYSGRQFLGLPWTKELLDIKARIEPIAQTTFNSVLLNYYRDGNDSMGWHSDDEPELGINPIIASANFGQERRFDFRKTDDHQQKYNINLTNGSLLIMKGNLQHHWQHQVAKSKKAMGARVNLTFRVVT